MNRLNIAYISHEPYSLRVDYDVPTNSIVITSANARTGEAFENWQAGEFHGVCKFNAETVGDYIQKSWGKALPGYDPRIGFIYSHADLELRKGLVSEDVYLEIKNKYPVLPGRRDTLSGPESGYMHRVVSYSKSAELDVRTGIQVPGTMPQTMIDNVEANWSSKLNVPMTDIRITAPEMAEAVATIDPRAVHYMDPIEADIWRVFGGSTKKSA